MKLDIVSGRLRLTAENSPEQFVLDSFMMGHEDTQLTVEQDAEGVKSLYLHSNAARAVPPVATLGDVTTPSGVAPVVVPTPTAPVADAPAASPAASKAELKKERDEIKAALTAMGVTFKDGAKTHTLKNLLEEERAKQGALTATPAPVAVAPAATSDATAVVAPAPQPIAAAPAPIAAPAAAIAAPIAAAPVAAPAGGVAAPAPAVGNPAPIAAPAAAPVAPAAALIAAVVNPVDELREAAQLLAATVGGEGGIATVMEILTRYGAIDPADGKPKVSALHPDHYPAVLAEFRAPRA